MQLLPARLGGGAGDRLAGLCPGRIRRPRAAGPRARVPPPRRRSARHGLPPDARGNRRRPTGSTWATRSSVESFTDPEINRNLLIQPDGTITLRLLGQVHATGRTVTQLRDALDELYKKYYKIPAITVTPLKVNTKLEDLRATIDRRAGIGGQSQAVRVTPEGTIALPAIGSVQAQGLTLPELQTELNERYRQVVEGIQVIPILAQRAPRYVYVLGEVNNPGRFELVGPTTALQAIAWPAVGAWGPTCGRSSSSAAATIGGCWPR